MDGLRRLVVLGILIGSCSGLGTEPDPDQFGCTVTAPDTMTMWWPDRMTLVLGSADDVWIERAVEDGCSYEPLPLAGLTIETRDPTVATVTPQGDNGGRVTPERPGQTWVVFAAPGLADSIPVSVPDTFPMADVKALAAGGARSCAVDDSGQVFCWGGDYSGLLGGPDDPAVGTCYGTPCSPMPKPLGVTAEQVFLGFDRECLLDALGMSCREFGSWRDLSSLGLVSVTVGTTHRCGLTEAGAAYCWGSNEAGQLGGGRIGSDFDEPGEVFGEHTWASLDAGDSSTCGVDNGGRLYCWGVLPTDVPGVTQCELSPGYKSSDPVYAPCAGDPVRIAMGEALGADTLLASIAGRCALTTTGAVLCAPVGSSRFSRLAPPGSFVSIHAGLQHHCGLTADGVARCWGQNDVGQLGTAPGGGADTPATVAGGHRFTDLALGDMHSCGLTTAREVWCWGGNDVGQASGSILEVSTGPRKVRGQGDP